MSFRNLPQQPPTPQGQQSFNDFVQRFPLFQQRPNQGNPLDGAMQRFASEPNPAPGMPAFMQMIGQRYQGQQPPPTPPPVQQTGVPSLLQQALIERLRQNGGATHADYPGPVFKTPA